MTSREFIERLTIAAYVGGEKSVVSQLERPPGRQPTARATLLSEWYRNQTPESREQIAEIIRTSVGAGVFQVLCVIDGVVSMRQPGEKPGRFELHYVNDQHTRVINRIGSEMLHDLFADALAQE